MQPQEPKSIGGALVDVFDAALSLVKTELRTVSRQVGAVVKAKGIGAVLLLAAAAPLSLALIFLILAVYFGLIRLGLAPWSSALVIALVALAVTALLVLMGLKRLSAEVKDDTRPADVRAREEAEAAQKRLENAEKKYEKNVQQGEKKVEKAEKQYEQAQRDLQREQAHVAGGAGGYAASGPISSGSTASSNNTVPTVPTASPSGSTSTFVGSGAGSSMSAGSSTGGHAVGSNAPVGTPVPLRKVSDEDGIPVSTKPQLEALDKEERK